METAKTKTLVDEDDLGCVLHTALRKACDSRATSFAYNLVALVDDSERLRLAWQLYRTVAYRKLSSVGAEVVDPVNCLKWAAHDLGFEGSDETHREFRSEMEKARGGLTLLLMAFDDFDDDDWGGFATWVVEEAS